MSRNISLLVALLIIILTAAVHHKAHGHDYGLASIDRHIYIECSDNTLSITYTADYGEILSVELKKSFDRDNNSILSTEEKEALGAYQASQLKRSLFISVQARDLEVACKSAQVEEKTGDYNLPNIHVQTQCHAPVSQCPESLGDLEVVDTWRQTTAGRKTLTVALGGAKAYRFVFTSLERPEIRASSEKGGLKSHLLQLFKQDASALSVTLMLALSFVLGAAHSLSPGHGKSLIAAYFMGRRGTIKEAATLSISIVLSHTLVIYALAFALLIIEKKAVDMGGVIYWLRVLSGASVFLIGIYLFATRLKRSVQNHHHNGKNVSTFLLGLSYGMAPCPTGLAIMLAAVSSAGAAAGIAVLLSFSMGLGAVVFTISAIAVKLGDKLISRFFSRNEKALYLLSLTSAFFICVLGLFLLYQSLYV